MWWQRKLICATKKEVKKLFDWLDSLFFGFVRLNFLLCERQLLKSQQNLNWNSNVSVSALQNDIALHKKEIVGWNFLYITIRHICAWQFLLLLCNHFLGLKSDIYLTISCQKLSDSPSDPIENSSQSIYQENTTLFEFQFLGQWPPTPFFQATRCFSILAFIFFYGSI